MNDLISRLHTSIRRFCIEHYSGWAEKYGEIRANGGDRIGYGYSDSALSTFPRYLYYEAALEQIERYRPDEFASVDDAKAFFSTLAGETQLANENVNGQTETAAVREEREVFARFIAEQSPASLANVEPLFYRRVLSEPELKEIAGKVDARWNLDKGYWYPLIEDRPACVEAFRDSYFEEEVGFETLRGLLSRTQTVWELREWGASYEIDVSVFEPTYNGAEGFWSDNSFNWIIYASHEGSITIGGWLLEEVKSNWPNWHERIWTWPFSTT
jgi:hypothetical protein